MVCTVPTNQLTLPSAASGMARATRPMMTPSTRPATICGPNAVAQDGKRDVDFSGTPVEVELGMTMPFENQGSETQRGTRGRADSKKCFLVRVRSERARTHCARLQAKVDVTPTGQEQHCPHTTRSFNYSIPRVAAGVRFVFVGRAPISHCWSVD